jgi:hypothetical protein
MFSCNARTRFNATATDCVRYGREKRTAWARSTVRETEDTAMSTSPAATWATNSSWVAAVRTN